MREIKLRMQVLQAARRLSRVAHAKPCHWSEGVLIMWGVTAGNASHNASNAWGVTAGKMGCNCSGYNDGNFFIRAIQNRFKNVKIPFQNLLIPFFTVSDLPNSVFYRFRYLKFRFIFLKPYFCCQ